MDQAQLDALIKEKRNLWKEEYDRVTLTAIDEKLRQNSADLEKADPDFFNQVLVMESDIGFLLSETHEDEMGQEMTKFAQEEVEYRESQIAEITSSRNEASGGLWEKRQKLRDDRRTEVHRLDYIGRPRIEEIDRILAPYRKPKKPPELSAEEQATLDALNPPLPDFETASQEELHEWFWGQNHDPDSPEHQIENLQQSLEISEWEKKWLQISFDRLERQLAEKGTVEERYNNLKLTIEAHTIYKFRSKAQIKEKNENNRNWRYTEAVTKLGTLEKDKVEGQMLTVCFKPQKFDKPHTQNGHSKAMLALRTGFAVDYEDYPKLKVTLHRRRDNGGNQVDCEIHNGDQRIQCILGLEVDKESSRTRIGEGDYDFVIGTALSYLNSYFVEAEEHLMPKGYKDAHKPIEWFKQHWPKVQAEAMRRFHRDKNKKKASG
jgi:hypothetical protein